MILDSRSSIQAVRHAARLIAYRDTTWQFYDDKIRGSSAGRCARARGARETARRAFLLAFGNRA